jgi:hypothetical protein
MSMTPEEIKAFQDFIETLEDIRIEGTVEDV